MPIVQISLLHGRPSALRAALGRAVTRAVCDSLDVPPATVRVLITEIAAENWFVAGEDKDRQEGPR